MQTVLRLQERKGLGVRADNITCLVDELRGEQRQPHLTDEHNGMHKSVYLVGWEVRLTPERPNPNPSDAPKLQFGRRIDLLHSYWREHQPEKFKNDWILSVFHNAAADLYYTPSTAVEKVPDPYKRALGDLGKAPHSRRPSIL